MADYIWIRADDRLRHVVDADEVEWGIPSKAVCGRNIVVLGYIARGRNCDDCLALVSGLGDEVRYLQDDSDFREDSNG